MILWFFYSLVIPPKNHLRTREILIMVSDMLKTDILLYIALSEEFHDLADELVDNIGFELTPRKLETVAITTFQGKIFSHVLNRNFHLTVVPAGKMGCTRAASVISTTISETKPSNVVVLGIAGSVSDDTQPGDVFIPDTVWEYLANSATKGESDGWEFVLSGNSLPTEPRLLNNFQLLKRTNNNIYNDWIDDCKDRINSIVTEEMCERLTNAGVNLRPAVKALIGDDKKLASGPAVGKGKVFCNWIRSERGDRKVTAMEMESAGVYDATFIHTSKPRVIAIRGISDYADERKKLIEDITKDKLREASLKNALSLLIHGIKAGLFEEEKPTHDEPVKKNNPSTNATSFSLERHKELQISPVINNKLKQITEQLETSCRLSEAMSEELDKSLSDHDIERFNRLQQDMLDVSSSMEEQILSYIECYLVSRPRGELSRFKIRFTDSRALFGVEKLYEWIGQVQYLERLDKLTSLAANVFNNEGLVTRTFIIPSFTELSLDPALKQVLKDILKHHLLNKISVSIVSIRLLDDLGFDSINFCIFEGGHLMKLDLGPASTLKIYDEKSAHRFNVLHDNLNQDKRGIIVFNEATDLATNYEAKILEQAHLETMGTNAIIIPSDKKVGEQYTEKVARWWADPQWDNERRDSEAVFLGEWLTKSIGLLKEPILDAACGTGTHSSILAELGYTVKACDASLHQIERARALAKRRQKLALNPQPQNPFYRTLSWHELPNHYDSVFRALLCLGGSLIHASASDLPAVAKS